MASGGFMKSRINFEFFPHQKTDALCYILCRFLASRKDRKPTHLSAGDPLARPVSTRARGAGPRQSQRYSSEKSNVRFKETGKGMAAGRLRGLIVACMTPLATGRQCIACGSLLLAG
jgi:hypothetical protein